MGVGAGAVGFLSNTRYYPTTDIEGYINNPLKIQEESLTQEELLTEKLFLGWRSNIGVDKTILNEAMKKQADFLVEKEKLIMVDHVYYNENYFIADELVLFVLG
jgi:oxygen-independent coproporphyrinogen-3 oxidase